MGKDLTKVRNTIFICTGGSCKKQAAEDSVRELRCALKMAGLHENTHTIKTLCMGQCENAPVMFVDNNNTWYKKMTKDTIEDLVSMKLEVGKTLESNEFYKKGWKEMQPAKIITPKTRSELQWQDDAVLGRVNSIRIYPWEFNTYPLLKECFTQRWEGLSLFTKKHGAIEGKCHVEYSEGKAFIHCPSKDISIEIVMKAVRESEEFPHKISEIKLFHTEDEKQFGLHFSNLKEGVVLQAHWEKSNGLWEHLINNYARISS
ncbi:(2Fe-2S) ferredoxin domain-containing protein [Fulvivirga sp. M361]|uniref:(2Fe-2S) ferredoxin domain-containing protein n=1 Tax=Fulvivirga sp. M361 TaxID=2594266 RepID=UPI00117A4733|nr:(2Fe-2S) ferredoxin domain-containing protein [Fulvivirga sp. M361]TRX62751.1 (2Fe-2S) ferredoxin domain-containing protein [Fulvivirga sp. M361]